MTEKRGLVGIDGERRQQYIAMLASGLASVQRNRVCFTGGVESSNHFLNIDRKRKMREENGREKGYRRN